MPTYEYRCPACKHDFEKFQRMSDEPKAECPACGADAVRRLSGGAGLLFKGSGFYITDYRSDSYKKEAGSDGGGTKSAPDKGKSGGESGEKKASDAAVSKPKSESGPSSAKDS